MDRIRPKLNLPADVIQNDGKVRRNFKSPHNTVSDHNTDIFRIDSQQTQKIDGPDIIQTKATIRNPEEAILFLESYNKNLGIQGKDLEEKYEKMLESPFSFFRVNPALFYKDIKGIEPKLSDKPAPVVTINADSHIMNFGTIKTAGGGVVWGLNDYDHSNTGPFTLDLLRLGAGALLTAEEMGLDGDDKNDLIEDMGKKYFKTVEKLSSGDANPGAFIKKSEAESLVEDLIIKADTKNQESFLGRIFKKNSSGSYQFIKNEEVHSVSAGTAEAVRKGLEDYQNRLKPNCAVTVPLEILDIARKTKSGGSSYGLERFYVLASHRLSGELPLILELKQLLPSSVKDQSGDSSKTDGPSITGYQKMQGGLLNPLSGHLIIDGKNFLAREKEPQKDTVDLNELKSKKDLSDLLRQCAKVLARAHCQGPGAGKAISRWFRDDEKKIIDNLKRFSKDCASQTRADYNALRDSIRNRE